MFKAFGNAFELNVALRVPKALWDLKISLLRTTSADAERQKKKKNHIIQLYSSLNTFYWLKA